MGKNWKKWMENRKTGKQDTKKCKKATNDELKKDDMKSSGKKRREHKQNNIYVELKMQWHKHI